MSCFLSVSGRWIYLLYKIAGIFASFIRMFILSMMKTVNRKVGYLILIVGLVACSAKSVKIARKRIRIACR